MSNKITYIENKTIRLSVKINELFMLTNILDGADTKKIYEYFTKKNHKSQINEYREHSKKYNQELAKDIVISQLPDHDVKDIGEVTITNPNEYNDIKTYHLMEHTYVKTSYHFYDDNDHYDSDEGYDEEIKELFLVENPYHVYSESGIISRVDHLLKYDFIKDALLYYQKEQMKQSIYKRLETFTEDKIFEVIYEIICEHQLNFKKISYYRKYNTYFHAVVVYDAHDDREKNPLHIYDEEEIRQVYNDWKNNRKFYDLSDKLVEFRAYSSESYYEFWKRMTELEKEKTVS